MHSNRGTIKKILFVCDYSEISSSVMFVLTNGLLGMTPVFFEKTGVMCTNPPVVTPIMDDFLQERDDLFTKRDGVAANPSLLLNYASVVFCNPPVISAMTDDPEKKTPHKLIYTDNLLTKPSVFFEKTDGFAAMTPVKMKMTSVKTPMTSVKMERIPVKFPLRYRFSPKLSQLVPLIEKRVS